MSRMARWAQRAVFGAATVAALGFGARQAVAAPAEAAVRACTNEQCNADCRRWGYDGGICAGSWGCACWIQ